MAPRLDFNPALGSNTVIPLSHSVSKHVKLNFYVTLSRFWYGRFQHDGRKIEVWSNIPTHEGGYSSWKENAFVERRDVVSTSEPVVDLEDSPIASISLVNEEEFASSHSRHPTAEGSEADRVTLAAQFLVPQIAGARYSYTFRLAGPHGHVEWLGNMGTNGYISVGGGGDWSTLKQVGLAENDSRAWKVAEDGKTWEREADVGSSEEVSVAQFKDMSMSGWTFSQDGPKQISTTTGAQNSSFVMLHPDPVAQDDRPLFEVPSSLLIAADVPSAISIKEGAILSTSGSTISVMEINESSLNTIHSLVSGATLGTYEVVHAAEDKKFIFVSPSPAATFVPSSTPQTISIIPVSPQDNDITTVSIPTGLLRALQPATPDILLFCEATNGLVNVDSDYAHEMVNVIVGRNGGVLTAIPLYTVKGESESDGEAFWKISIIEPAVSPISVEDVIPPPPEKVVEVVVEPESPVEVPATEAARPNVDITEEVFSPPKESPATADPVVTDEFTPAPGPTFEDIDETEPGPLITSKPKAPPRPKGIVGLFKFCLGEAMYWIRVFLHLWAAGWLFRASPPRGNIKKTSLKPKKEEPSEDMDERFDDLDKEPLQVVDDDKPIGLVEVKDKVKEHVKTAILTPPTTPPQSPLVSLNVSPFGHSDPDSSCTPSIGAPSPVVEVAPTKQKVEFTLPPNANKFVCVLQRTDYIRGSLTMKVDGKGIYDYASFKTSSNRGANGDYAFVLSVDIPSDFKKDGKVEIFI